MPRPISRNQLRQFWLDNFAGENFMDVCGLCANHGIIDTRGKLTAPNGQPAKGGRYFCICPNGQTMKRKGDTL